MATFSIRTALTLTLFLTSAVTIGAQEVAGTSEVGAALTVQTVLDQCALAPAGTCVESSQAYVAGLEAQALPSADYTQSLADYLATLVEVAQNDPVCNAIDFAVADALDSAAPRAIDAGQASQMREIARTLRACEDFQTAAVGDPASAN